MRLYFVNRFYWPSELATAQLLADLAEALAATHHSVTVITSHSASALPRNEERNGVRILRTGWLPGDDTILGRLVAFAAFHCTAFWLLWRNVRRGDVIVALTDPPLVGVTAGLVARLRGAVLAHWVQDIYPDVLQAASKGAAIKFLCAALKPARDWAWRHASACVTLGEDMAATMRPALAQKDRLHVIPNWAPAGLSAATPNQVATLRREWSGGARFIVAYSGNLGRAHDLSGLLEVAETFRAEPAILFLLVGGGAGYARLRAEVLRRGLPNVRFLPPRPRGELSRSLSVADVHLISLRPGWEKFVFPSKLYGVAAVGRPLLLLGSGNSELAEIVLRHRMGAVFEPHDTEGISAYVKELSTESALARALAAGAATFSAENGGIARACRQWQAILDPLASAR